jgi:solute carrier family 12 (potassium/chloride transporter), member 4/6
MALASTVLDIIKSPFKRKAEKEQAEPLGKERYGTFFGVYLPNILNVIGVIFFLRLGVVIGNVGLAQTLIIIGLSFCVTTLTALSLSATATNGKVGDGGTYYMVSRCFGFEIGSAIGIFLYLSQGISAAFCVLGFAESIASFFPTIPVPILGVITLSALSILSYFSTDLVMKAQLVIFTLLALSGLSLAFGHPIEMPDPATVASSLSKLSFWGAFALFFPAATGIEAGAAMSGTLKKPSTSLPLGTLLTLATAIGLYIITPIFLTRMAPEALLASDPMIMLKIAKVGSLIYIGIWGATLSSVLSGLLAAPRTLQALAKDRVLPSFIGREFGEKKEPKIAVVLTFLFIFSAVYLFDLDALGPLLSMFMLIAYGMLNLASGFEELLGSPSWRPTFKVPWLVSIIGGALCLFSMFMINAGASFLSLLLTTLLCLIMKRRRLDVHWDDIRQGLLTFLARFAIYRLSSMPQVMRSWRPNFLLFTETPSKLPSSGLFKVAQSITHERGFLTIASILSRDAVTEERRQSIKRFLTESLFHQSADALIDVSRAKDPAAGMKKMISSYGIGSLVPDTIVLEAVEKERFALHYLEAIKAAHDQNRSVILLSENEEKLKALLGKRNKIRNIDIWWDERSRNTSELMVLLGHMLKRSHQWKKAKITIKSVAADESARVQRLEYFKEFLSRGRFEIETEVFVSPERSLFKLISQFSSKETLIMLGMRPQGEDETVSEYCDREYQPLRQLTKEFPLALYALSAERDYAQIFS